MEELLHLRLIFFKTFQEITVKQNQVTECQYFEL